MLSFRSVALALFSAPLLALAQGDGFNWPVGTQVATAGSSYTFTWNVTTSPAGTVTLSLRQGASNNLDKVTVIAPKVDNSGSYAWSVPSDTVAGTDYSVQITSDEDTSVSNYSPYFVVDSTVHASASVSSSSATESASASASGSTTGTSSAASVTVTSSASHNPTAKSTTSGSPSSTSGGAGFPSTSPTHNGVPRATAMAGVLGMLALGAMAL